MTVYPATTLPGSIWNIFGFVFARFIDTAAASAGIITGAWLALSLLGWPL